MSAVNFQGIFRARAILVKNGVITAYVPQVFGDTTITITDVIGGAPEGPTDGWVFFESGWTEFPVWTSSGAFTAGNGSTPTTPTPSPEPSPGGGVNEVWVGPGDPPDTTTELWYDTDATAPASTVWVQMTQAAYNALPVKDPTVLYVIIG